VSTPDYSGKAVTVRVADGPEPRAGIWRNQCPVDCGWHGSDWEGRGNAVNHLLDEVEGHQCLRAARPEPEGRQP